MKPLEPLSQQTLRNQNLSLLLGTVLRHEEVTRKHLERETGLSKATVWRFVDDLIDVGAVVTRTSEPVDRAVRGRRPGALCASSALGASAGLSLGLRTSSVHVTDLLGNEIAYEQAPTRRWRNLREAVAWSADIVSAALDAGQTRLRRVVVAVPARAINGQVVARLPLFMSAIEGPEFGGLLMERLGCSVRIETDAAMILAGLEALRLLDRGSFPVLLNLGSVLTMSLRRADGTIAEGRSSSFGDFGLIPVETDLGRFRIGGLLGAHGLFEASRGLGRELPAMEDLWQSDSEDVRRLGRAFAVALEHAVRVIVVMSDPSEIVFTGRLVPLVERSLDVLERQLKAEVDQPPTLRIVNYAEEGHAAAVGAADEARAGATAELLERIAREGIEALR